MQGRRRETRFLMSPPWVGALQTLEDVVVERIAEKDIWVLSASPANREDALIFEMPDNTEARVNVRVAESRPVVVDDRLRHRVRLHVEGESHGPPPSDTGGNDQR
jgi:hypothetical protein